MNDTKKAVRNSTAEFLIFSGQNKTNSIEVHVADETVWLTQKLIGKLFDKGRSTISEHLIHIFKSNELDEKAVCRNFLHTAKDKKNSLENFYFCLYYYLFLRFSL